MFKPGFIAAAIFGVVLILTSLLMRWLEVRDEKKRERTVDSVAEPRLSTADPSQRADPDVV